MAACNLAAAFFSLLVASLAVSEDFLEMCLRWQVNTWTNFGILWILWNHLGILSLGILSTHFLDHLLFAQQFRIGPNVK